ncbi:hypothetical protein LX36DRAFT_84793 [Colletotrichum falcatum]|nr:hypothetical protein LX36DRAFT_84793 [Colletotrichum falcatum]
MSQCLILILSASFLAGGDLSLSISRRHLFFVSYFLYQKDMHLACLGRRPVRSCLQRSGRRRMMTTTRPAPRLITYHCLRQFFFRFFPSAERIG